MEYLMIYKLTFFFLGGITLKIFKNIKKIKLKKIYIYKNIFHGLGQRTRQSKIRH